MFLKKAIDFLNDLAEKNEVNSMGYYARQIKPLVMENAWLTDSQQEAIESKIWLATACISHDKDDPSIDIQILPFVLQFAILINQIGQSN